MSRQCIGFYHKRNNRKTRKCHSQGRLRFKYCRETQTEAEVKLMAKTEEASTN